MALSERDRRELHGIVEAHLGGRAADLVLAMTEPELPALLRGEMAELRGDMNTLRSELRGEMNMLRSEVRGEMAELRGEMAELRGEMAELGAKVDGHVPKIIAANIAAMIGVAGLVLAAGAIV